MSAPTGLYGHVQANQSRSLLLFGLFLVAFQLLGVVTLWVPLLMFDPAHDALYHPAAYARRYVPLLFALSFVLYSAQMWWFVGSVRRRTKFHYVDSNEEPRFCRILEPLAIAAGIEVPYAAVIESASLNAFAAGTRKHHMVAVVTRGLLNGLDDDELAAVLANSVIHIRNRDTRLLAAASIFMRNMTVLHRKPRKVHPLQTPLQAVGLVLLPVFLPVILVLGFFVQIAFRLAYGSRALIGISRELIADAEAVRLTHNPAALASALRKIEGLHGAGELGDEHDAMLFVGVTEGHLATHPTTNERVGALARTTGSLVLEDTRRLDTRPVELRRASGFGRRPDPKLERIATLAEEPERRGLWGAFWSVRDPEYNWFGLSQRETWAVTAGVLGIAFFHSQTLASPGGPARLFDVAAIRQLSGSGTTLLNCTIGGIDATEEELERCEKQAAEAGGLFDEVAFGGDGKKREHLTPKEQEERRGQEQVERGCFAGRWSGFATSSNYDLTLDDYLRFARTGPAKLDGVPPGPQLDEKLLTFAESRLLQIDNALHFFGEFGFAAFADATNSPENQAVLDLVAQRLQDPEFAKKVPPRKRAELELLVTKRSELKPCWAERVAKAQAVASS